MRWRRGRAAKRTRGPNRGKAADGAGLATRVTGFGHVFVVLNPGTDVGPEPVRIPVTGYNLYLDLAADGAVDAVLRGLHADVVRRSSLEPDGVSLVPQPGPALILDKDLADARRRDLENYRPLEAPDVEVFLDETPPLVRAALDGHGAPVRPWFRLPLRIPAGTATRVVLAPITGDRGLVDWQLTADVAYGDHSARPRWGLQVTAETTFRTAYPDGRALEPTPVHRLAPHWKPARPPGASAGP